MPARREFLTLLAAPLLGAGRPQFALVSEPPPESLVFRRAYSACPDSTVATILTGTFPHARATHSLDRFFERAHTPTADTIVIGFSDAGLHIPLAIRYPGRLQPAVTDVLISTVDVLPTLLGLAGFPVPGDLHGRDLSTLLTTGSGEQPSSIFAEGNLNTPSEWRLIVRGWDKMVTTAGLEPLHLYNLRDDPDEQDDLAREPGHRLRIDELRAVMLAWRKQTGDGVDRSGLKRR